MLPVGLVIRVINSTGKIKDNFTRQVESFARLALASKEQNPDSLLWCNKEMQSQTQNGYPRLTKPQHKSK